MSLQSNPKNALPPDCEVLLNQIKQIGPKVFSYFQFDLFGLVLCIAIFILGLTPCIGFATISYNAQSGGTHPDTNENLRTLLFVAPTTFFFAVGFCVFRLTNRKFPWTQITFDFLEGSVTYRTGTGMRFLVNALCDLFCCGCFCFLSDDEILLNGAVDEAFSQGVRRAMFSEIKEIGVGSRFLSNNNTNGSSADQNETEYVVGLKIRRKTRRRDIVAVTSDVEKRSVARITIGAQRNKSNADYYLEDIGNDEDESEREKRRRPRANEEKDEMETELIVTPKSSNDDNSKKISSNSFNGSNRSADDDNDDTDRNLSRTSVNKVVNRDLKETPLLNEQDSSSNGEGEDKEYFEEYIELVPLDVVTSKENVARTIKFWKRWMRQQYDSTDETENKNEEARIRMKDMRQKESTPSDEETPSSSRNPLTKM